jgi:hypothetical protein
MRLAAARKCFGGFITDPQNIFPEKIPSKSANGSQGGL